MAIYENANSKLRYQRDKERIKERARLYRRRKSSGDYVNAEEVQLAAYKLRLDNLPDTVVAYIAGIVDGEGCICLIKSDSQLRHGSGVAYRGSVTIVNTSKTLFEFLGRALGYKWWYTGQKTKPHYKDSFKWIRSGRFAWLLCERILPYLVIKKDKAEMLCELYHGGTWGRKGMRDIAELERREAIWRRFRGVDSTTR